MLSAHCKILFIITEELSDLKGQIKILEEKNTTYLQTNMELEEVSMEQFLDYKKLIIVMIMIIRN